MFLKYRPVRLSDLDECQYCIRDGFAYDAKSRANLVEMWSELLRSGAANAAVIEDISAPPGSRIVWFCFKVFITEHYANYLKTEAPPLIGRQMLASWLKGGAPELDVRAMPVLDAGAIRRANSRNGLTMLILHSGAPEHIMAGDKRRMLFGNVVEFSCYFQGGYRCNEMLAEYYDDFTATWASNAGFRERTDYADYHAKRPLERPFAGQSPRLFGVTAWEAVDSVGTIASVILAYEPPRLFFSPPQQDLLLHALLGETDEEVSHSLDIALVTVRKRWDSIYSQVADIAQDLLPADTRASGDSKRGCEKKRHLLSYLRRHLEELRPVERPKAG